MAEFDPSFAPVLVNFDRTLTEEDCQDIQVRFLSLLPHPSLAPTAMLTHPVCWEGGDWGAETIPVAREDQRDAAAVHCDAL